MISRSSRCMVSNPITCCSVMRWASTPRGMGCPQHKKTEGAFRPLERGPNLLIRTNRQLAARYGVLPGDVNSTVLAAIGGQAATQVLEGDWRFDGVVRFLPQYRSPIEAIGNIP